MNKLEDLRAKKEKNRHRAEAKKESKHSMPEAS